MSVDPLLASLDVGTTNIKNDIIGKKLFETNKVPREIKNKMNVFGFF